ncbi:MAG: hypothetical protein AAEJ04_07925 [Planctomycetota bacterium]
MFKLAWMIFCSLLCATGGAILLGEFTSVPLSLAGGALGLVVGWLLGKYIPIYEWFV